jgi:uncharacterized protein
VEYEIPMSLRMETMPDNPNRLAFMYGPLVLAGDLGPIDGSVADSGSEASLAHVLIGSKDSLLSSFSMVDPENNVFRLEGVSYGGDRLLRPFYMAYDHKYTVYWDFFTEEEWQRAEAEYRSALEYNLRLEQLTVDFVQPAEMQPERDHKFEGEHVGLGSIHNRKYRDTWPNGWFSFVMAALPDAPLNLAVTYIKQAGERSGYDILVDGHVLQGGQLESEELNKFETFVYELPEQLTAGKSELTVKFASHPGCRVAQVAGLRVVRR